LTKLRPKKSDSYPLSLIDFLKMDMNGNIQDFEYNSFGEPYSQILEINWDDESYQERLFKGFTSTDQFDKQHFLPLFLSKITNPDQTIIKFNEEGKPIDGIRTFAECAHYSRCIPFCEDKHPDYMMWCSPDFIVGRKIGTEEDHALLMASLMRTVKYENYSEFNKWAKKSKEETKTKKDKQKEVLKLDG
jgi:hypothetical protein